MKTLLLLVTTSTLLPLATAFVTPAMQTRRPSLLRIVAPVLEQQQSMHTLDIHTFDTTVVPTTADFPSTKSSLAGTRIIRYYTDNCQFAVLVGSIGRVGQNKRRQKLKARAGIHPGRDWRPGLYWIDSPNILLGKSRMAPRTVRQVVWGMEIFSLKRLNFCTLPFFSSRSRLFHGGRGHGGGGLFRNWQKLKPLKNFKWTNLPVRVP